MKTIELDIIIPAYRLQPRYLLPILQLEAPDGLKDKIFTIVADNPTVTIAPELQVILQEKSAQLIVNKENMGAQESRNFGIDHTSGEWILFLDDDILPESSILDAYFKWILSDSLGYIGAAGTTVFPKPINAFTNGVLASDILTFFDLPDHYQKMKWGVTANVLIRRSDLGQLRFSKEFPKFGGGEDIDLFIRVGIQTGKEFAALPAARVHHPWWNEGQRSYRRFFRWAFGDSLLPPKYSQHRYLNFPNVAETLAIALLLIPLLIAFTGDWTFVLSLPAIVLAETFVEGIKLVRNKRKFSPALAAEVVLIRASNDLGRLWGNLSRMRPWAIMERFDYFCDGKHIGNERRWAAFKFLSFLTFTFTMIVIFKNHPKMIKIAIAGIGNCASSLVQGIHQYRGINAHSAIVPGLLHNEIAGFGPGAIEVVAAFDVDERKVGKRLGAAITALPNNTKQFCKVPRAYGPTVRRGPTLDGISDGMRIGQDAQIFLESNRKPIDVAAELRRSGAQMLISYLPVGSEQATRHYAESCLEAGVAFINATPVLIASDPLWAKAFEEKGLICAGDDIKSQLGATIVHRTLVRLFELRGIQLTHTYQLNVGGNSDFRNMLDRTRLETKKKSKTQAVVSQYHQPIDATDIHIGPSDYVPWMHDNKVAFIRLEGELFGGVPMNIELRLSVEDSPNSAGVMIDVIRLVKLATQMGYSGPIDAVNAFAFKHPPKQFTDEEAMEMVDRMVKGG